MRPRLSQRASYEPHPWRERLKPILDELQDTLERFEGEPTRADHRWLRGQLRRLADRLDPWNGQPTRGPSGHAPF